MIIALLAAATITTSSCADPSISSTGVQSATPSNGLERYTIAVVVRNDGNVRQPGDLLQSLDVTQDHQIVDRIGLQPLRPHQSEKVTYSFSRSADAGDGTTRLDFIIDENGRAGSDIDCGEGVESTVLHV